MKALEASCVAGVVTVEGMPVEAEILSEGVGESDGFVLIDRATVVYLTNVSSDIKALIEKLGDVVTKIATIATGIDGATNAPGAQTASIAELTVLQTELVAMGEMLK